MQMHNQVLQEKINETANLALRYFRGLLQEALGDKFSATVLTYLPIDKINWDAITFEHTIAEFQGNINMATSEDFFNIIKVKVKNLANKVLKDLKACHPAKIKFGVAPDATPYPSHISVDEDTNISLRLTFGQRFAENKRKFEIAVYYLIIPTGENQNG